MGYLRLEQASGGKFSGFWIVVMQLLFRGGRLARNSRRDFKDERRGIGFVLFPFGALQYCRLYKSSLTDSLFEVRYFFVSNFRYTLNK